MKYYAGIDLGGTNISVGVVDEDYRIIAKASTKTNCPRPAEEIADDMAKTTLQAVEKAGITVNELEWIGVGTPGIANNATGIIEYSNNLDFHNVPICELIKKTIDKPVYIANDANAAAFGEYIAGAAKDARNAVCITLGTGVGGGIIINGKIFTGSNCGGAEIGHTVVSVDGPICTCGRRGCFEVFSSATGLVRMTKEALAANPDSLMHNMLENDRVSARVPFNAMREGDAAAKEVCDKYIKYLAAGITNVINVFQPDVVCIGGGVCNEGDALLVPVTELVNAEVYTRSSIKTCPIVRATLGNDAGIIGAAFLGNS